MVQKRACDACHKRKIQCDSSSSSAPCNWCEHHDLDCTFNRVRGRKRPPKSRSKQASENSLAERLKRIEDALSLSLPGQGTAEKSTSKPLTPVSLATNLQGGSDISVREPAKEPNEKPSRASSAFLRESTSTSGSPLLSQGSPFISQIPSPAGGFTSVVSYGQIHYGGCHFGHISQHNGIPLLSEEGKKWITSRTGQEILFDPTSDLLSQPVPSLESYCTHLVSFQV